MDNRITLTFTPYLEVLKSVHIIDFIYTGEAGTELNMQTYLVGQVGIAVYQ